MPRVAVHDLRGLLGLAFGGALLFGAPAFEVPLDELAIRPCPCELGARRIDLDRALVVRELGAELLVPCARELVPAARDESLGGGPLLCGAKRLAHLERRNHRGACMLGARACTCYGRCADMCVANGSCEISAAYGLALFAQLA